jgi:hypothetical protein
MTRLEWNALRVGAKVFVHDPADLGMPLLPGTVAIVETTRRSNDVGVSVADKAHRARVVRPNRLAVHSDPMDSSEECWRCAAIVSVGTQERAAVRVGAP